MTSLPEILLEIQRRSHYQTPEPHGLSPSPHPERVILMSEYQYYEFLAIDRPLTQQEMGILRSISSRAHITPVSFTNAYNWSDLKADPLDLMHRFFDAHVYVASWMTAMFMVRLPIETLSSKMVDALEMLDVIDFDSSKTHWVVTWSLNESEDYDRFGSDDGRGWMARLSPLREELLRGDLRSLYIGWLAAVNRAALEEDELEPIPATGMDNLTAAQQALVEFLEVDVDLLAGAAMGSPSLKVVEPSQKEVDEWLGRLPRPEVLNLLKHLLDGNGIKAERLLKNRFSEWRRGVEGPGPQTARRTLKQIRENAKKGRAIRLEQEKRKQEALKAKRLKERQTYLTGLAKNFPGVWKTAGAQIERGSGLGYNEACQTLKDLAEAYALQGQRHSFKDQLKRFMIPHMRRRALLERLTKAGLWP